MLRARRATESAARGLRGLAADTRFAFRTLRRSPGFTTVSVVTLALGIGAQGAVFALVDHVLLRPPPYERPEELVVVWATLGGGSERVAVAGPDAAAVEARSRTLRQVAFTTRGVDGALAHPAGTRHVRIAAVTTDFFDVLGVEATPGRMFRLSDGRSAGTGPVPVVLSRTIWRRDFEGDSEIVGRTVRIDETPATVVGVTPPGFALELAPSAGVSTDVDVWLPLRVPLTDFHREDGRLLDQDSDNTGALVARLADGVSVDAADQDARRIARELRQEVPAYQEAGLDFDARLLHADATADQRGLLTALFVAVGLVLLVVCLNLGTLLVARRMNRARELSVRTALGASRGHLTRQLVVEGCVLVALGALAAVVLAGVGADALVRLAPAAVLAPDDAALGGRAVDFVVVVSAVVAGLVSVAALVRPGRLGMHARSMLVSAEVAVSVALVLAACLLLRTVESLEAVRPGFEPEGALTFSISLRVPDRYRSPRSRAELMRAIESDVRALPEVTDVGLVGVLPLTGDRWTQPFGLPGQPTETWHRNRADFRVVTSGYFQAIGVRLLAGRSFTRAEDLDEEERVVVVDRRLARRIAASGSRVIRSGAPRAGAPGIDPAAAVDAEIGIPLDGAPVQARVVGVVEPVRRDALDREGREAIYVPYRQEASREVTFVVRTRRDPLAVAEPIRGIVHALDPALAVYRVRPLREYVAEAMAPRRFALASLAAFSFLALLCCAVGLYGVVSFDVDRRRRDLGVRLAVGARRDELVRSVLLRGARIGAPGLAVGLALAVLTARSLRSIVYGIGTGDLVAWTATVVVVATVTTAACAVPAWRAGGTDPAEVLRAE